MGAVFWDFPMRASRKLSIAEDEAAEAAYREWCARLIEAEVEEGKNDAPGRRAWIDELRRR